MINKSYSENVLVLLKMDATRLFERIKYRELEYMAIFSLKRTREHFFEIFKSRYDSVLISDLKLIDIEVLIEADNFYTKVDNLKWYLYHTEDLPGTAQNHVSKSISILEEALDNLNLYINGQLGYQEVA